MKIASSKPISRTIKDGIILASLSLIVVITMMVVYHYFMGTAMTKDDMYSILWQTIAITIVQTAASEYLGINNIIAESSMRYAKGSTLNKYRTRREALLYQCLYKLLNSKYNDANNVDTAEIELRARLIRNLIDHPYIRGKIADAAAGDKFESSVADIRAKHQDKEKIIETLLKIPKDSLPAIDALTDRLNEYIIYDILVNGFPAAKIDKIGSSFSLQPYQKLIDESSERGKVISRNIESFDNETVTL
jgi:hypothetical protein